MKRPPTLPLVAVAAALAAWGCGSKGGADRDGGGGAGGGGAGGGQAGGGAGGSQSSGGGTSGSGGTGAQGGGAGGSGGTGGQSAGGRGGAAGTLPATCAQPLPGGGTAEIPGPTEAEVAAQAVCTNGWCLENPFPAEGVIRGGWGTGGNAVWLAADGGEIVYWDGIRFRDLSPPFDPYPSFGYGTTTIWGSGPDNVWIAGDNGLLRFDGLGWLAGSSVFSAPGVHAIAGTGPDDVWFGRDRGLVRHLTAAGITEESIADGAILGLWAGSDRDVWAVGSLSTIFHYDGTGWRAVTPDRPLQAAELRAVWGSGSNDVWIIGAYGVLLHWDGQALTVERPFTDVGLSAIWGTGADPWIVSEGGGIFRRSAGVWCNVWSGPRLDFSWIWGAASDDVWGGADQRLFHWDGQAWRERSRIWQTSGTIAGTPDGQLWFTEGDQLMRWDGSRVDPVLSIPSGPGIPYYWPDLKVLGPTDIWTFTGPQGSMVPVRWDGQMLVPEPAPRNLNLHDIAGPEPDRKWACGDQVLLERQAGSWQPVASPSLAGTSLQRLWFRSATDGWAVGIGPTPVLRWDGTSWTAFTSAEVGSSYVGSVWGSGANDVWFTTAVGTLHFDGTAFTPVLSFTGVTITGASGLAITGTGPAQAWMAGSYGEIWSWDGARWTGHRSGTLRNLTNAWTTAAGEVFIAGDGGILFRRRPGATP